MVRTARASVGGVVYHVINRGNGRTRVFRKDEDYQAFIDLIGPACQRVGVRVLGYCLMPTHFHLVLWPRGDGDMSRWMQWLMTSHVRRYHRHYHSSGHVWQGRYKAFPIQQDEHLLRVLRYVEANPLRAKLVRGSEEWPWSSLAGWSRRDRPPWLTPWPVDRPRQWRRLVNDPLSALAMTAVANSVRRGAPLGQPAWTARLARRLGLQSTLNPRGRPPKNPKK